MQRQASSAAPPGVPHCQPRHIPPLCNRRVAGAMGTAHQRPRVSLTKSSAGVLICISDEVNREPHFSDIYAKLYSIVLGT
ncbi:unnamed protein product [Notodromas monacha]|uniref:Uncharacterized protein n=1 Tax=Notodromas monacha TaxID=399045 RepID=A0A7R9G9J5_9CRUS|nr:unnamed protein product [Notodromas monacha]CAG0913272.1 unnamed protein product [Notodromas monacha]